MQVTCQVSLDIQNQSDQAIQMFQKCNLPIESRTTQVETGPFLIIDFPINLNVNTVVPTDDINFLHKKYELVAATRFVNRNHFVTYVKYENNWYCYDGMGPTVTPVQVNSEKDFEGERNLFFYVQIVNTVN